MLRGVNRFLRAAALTSLMLLLGNSAAQVGGSGVGGKAVGGKGVSKGASGSGGGGGGGLTDLTWSGTASGAAKSSQAGFIAPVFFQDATHTRFARIFQVSSPESLNFCTERVLGETGAISATLALFASTNTASGTNFTPLSTTIAYADAVKGWRCVAIHILAIPTGFGIVGIQLSGGSQYHSYAYIWLQGTGHVVGAHYLTSLGSGTESSADTSGSGTSGAPWHSPYFAAHQMTCGVLYVRSATGSFQDTHSGPDSNGAFQFANNCTPANPLVVLSDPDNSSTPLFDNGLTSVVDSGTTVNVSAASAIAFSNSSNSVWLAGLNATHGDVAWQLTSGTFSNNEVLWKMDIGNHFVLGSNAAAVRYEYTDGLIAQDLTLHNVYSRETFHSNPFDSQPFGLKEGAITFHGQNAAFVQCISYVVEFGIFQKQAPADPAQHSADIEASYFYNTGPNSTNGGAAISFQIAGAGSPPFFNGIVRYNTIDNSASANPLHGALVFNTLVDGPVTGQSSYFDVYNNTSIGTDNFSQVDNTNFVRYWNNISEDETNFQIAVAGQDSGLISSLLWADYNYYVRPTYAWKVIPTSGNYTSLSLWQGASTSVNLVSPPDIHATSTSTTPSYANTASHNYSWANTLGQFGRPVGVGIALVGPQN